MSTNFDSSYNAALDAQRTAVCELANMDASATAATLRTLARRSCGFVGET